MRTLLLSVAAIGCATTCFVTQGSLAADNEIMIGAATASSGWMAPYDEDPVAAAQLAVDDINASGGVLGRKLKLQHVDTKTDRAQGAKAGVELVQNGARMLIVSSDFDMGGPAALVAQQKNVIAISPGGADIKLGNLSIGNNVFTMASDSAAVGAILADFAYKDKGWRTSYLLLDTIIEYNKSTCAGFEKHWVELAGKESIVGRDNYKNDDPSVSAQVTRFKDMAKKPDMIMLCGVNPGGASAIRQFRSAGIDTPIVAAVAFDGDAWHASVPTELLDRFYYGTYCGIRGDDPRPEIQEFLKKFKAKTGRALDNCQGDTGYSAVQGWALAAKRAGSLDTDKVRAEMEKFSDEPLLVGPTTFTSSLHTNLTRPEAIVALAKGKSEFLGYYSLKAGKMVQWWLK